MFDVNDKYVCICTLLVQEPQLFLSELFLCSYWGNIPTSFLKLHYLLIV